MLAEEHLNWEEDIQRCQQTYTLPWCVGICTVCVFLVYCSYQVSSLVIISVLIVGIQYLDLYLLLLPPLLLFFPSSPFVHRIEFCVRFGPIYVIGAGTSEWGLGHVT